MCRLSAYIYIIKIERINFFFEIILFKVSKFCQVKQASHASQEIHRKEKIIYKNTSLYWSFRMPMDLYQFGTIALKIKQSILFLNFKKSRLLEAKKDILNFLIGIWLLYNGIRIFLNIIFAFSNSENNKKVFCKELTKTALEINSLKKKKVIALLSCQIKILLNLILYIYYFQKCFFSRQQNSTLLLYFMTMKV